MYLTLDGLSTEKQRASSPRITVKSVADLPIGGDILLHIAEGDQLGRGKWQPASEDGDLFPRLAAFPSPGRSRWARSPRT
jgi:hypothetical protein